VEEMHRARYGEGAKSFHALFRHNTLPSETSHIKHLTPKCSTWKLSELCPFGF